MPADSLAHDLDAAYAARDWRRLTGIARAGLLQDPGRPEAWMMLAVASADGGDTGRAQQGFARAAAILPYWPDAWANLGRVEAAGTSVRAFRRALALAPSMIALLSPLALELLDLGDGTGAARLLRRAHGLDRNACDVCVNLGLALASLESEAAADWFAAAIALDPQEFTGHLNLGRQLLGIGDIDGSRDAARRALALRPASADAVRLDAALLRASGRADAAARRLESITARDIDAAAIGIQLATVRLDQRHLDAAYETLAGVYRRDPARLSHMREVLSGSATGELWLSADGLRRRLGG